MATVYVIKYLITSNCFVNFSLFLKELTKEFVCFGVPLLDFKILGHMSKEKTKMHACKFKQTPKQNGFQMVSFEQKRLTF